MRFRFLVALAGMALALQTGSALANCAGEVRAAFEKQSKLPAIRMVAKQPSELGPSTITLEYKSPDRFRQSVSAASEPGPVETQVVANRAWATQGGGWNELLPNFAGSIGATLRSQLVEVPEDLGEFECLNKVTVDGKEYVGYRSINKPASGSTNPQGVLVRTIYVDEATGLPALNIVSEVKEGAEPIFKGVYTYPDDIEIEVIEGAPIADFR